MSERARILVADDERNIRITLRALLQRAGHDVVLASDGDQALAAMSDDIDVVITDRRMPHDGDGMLVLSEISARWPHIPVIMITAYDTVQNAVEVMKAGAFDYIPKPFENAHIIQMVDKALRQGAADRQALTAVRDADDEVKGRFGLVGDSAPMQEIYAIIEKVADSPSTVLITGESGTGKELVARALHENSSRRDQAFIKINCAAIPKDLMESELFGYKKGAFTGAQADKPGRFELADGGTLFLDEIGEIPVEMQVKLLRAIQESEFERVGGIETIKVDVRLITATNRDLEQEIKAGNFRDDLYYRLNVVPLRIPPLRSRIEDIPLLVTHIIRKFNERLKKSITGIAPEALERLKTRAWPGNIRELENVLERTILFCSTDRIELSDLPDEHGSGERPRSSPEPERSTPITIEAVDPAVLNGDKSLKEIVRERTSEVEKELILKALEKTDGNVTQAAKLLKISRKSLQTKMKDFGLRDREADG